MDFKFKFDYCKDTTRTRFSTTLDEKLVQELKFISQKSKIPISKMIEATFAEHLKSQETFNNFLDIVRKY